VKAFVRACAVYNASAVIVFLTPGLLPRLGVSVPASPLWLWLPSIFAVFAALVLAFSAADLKRLGTLPYWNALCRLAFVAVAFTLDFASSAGAFVAWLALGDLVLGLGVVLALPRATGRSHLSLLLNRS
jgi:hypothetical protein